MADLSQFAQAYNNAGVATAFLPSNNYKTQPLTNYSTRVFEFFKIEIAAIEANYDLSNSLFTKALKGVQSIVQIVMVGTPAAGAVLVAVESDTTPTTGPAFDTDATPTKAERIKAAVDAATGAVSTVTALTAIGGALA